MQGVKINTDVQKAEKDHILFCLECGFNFSDNIKEAAKEDLLVTDLICPDCKSRWFELKFPKEQMS